MAKLVRTYAKYGNTELYSVGKYNYLGNSGKLYLLNNDELNKVLQEITSMSEFEKVEHLKKGIEEKRFRSAI